jgi:hypothetical protein
MARSRTKTFAFVLCIVPLVTLFTAACSGTGAERTLIRSYFLAARINDRPTLNNIAMVGFNPREDGTIRTFSIDGVADEKSRPLRLKELSSALMEAEQAEDDFTAEKVTYQDEHFEAINRVLEAEREEETVARRDAAVQEAWTDWRTRTMEFAKMVSGARVELDDERNAASLSVFDPNNPVELTEYDGELLTKDVSITADVELDGTETERSLVITLQKAVLTGSDGATIEGGWVIAQIG